MTWTKKVRYVDSYFDQPDGFDTDIFDDVYLSDPWTKVVKSVDDDWFHSQWFISGFFVGYIDWTKINKMSNGWTKI